MFDCCPSPTNSSNNREIFNIMTSNNQQGNHKSDVTYERLPFVQTCLTQMTELLRKDFSALWKGGIKLSLNTDLDANDRQYIADEFVKKGFSVTVSEGQLILNPPQISSEKHERQEDTDNDEEPLEMPENSSNPAKKLPRRKGTARYDKKKRKTSLLETIAPVGVTSSGRKVKPVGTTEKESFEKLAAALETQSSSNDSSDDSDEEDEKGMVDWDKHKKFQKNDVKKYTLEELTPSLKLTSNILNYTSFERLAILQLWLKNRFDEKEISRLKRTHPSTFCEIRNNAQNTLKVSQMRRWRLRGGIELFGKWPPEFNGKEPRFANCQLTLGCNEGTEEQFGEEIEKFVQEYEIPDELLPKVQWILYWPYKIAPYDPKKKQRQMDKMELESLTDEDEESSTNSSPASSPKPAPSMIKSKETFPVLSPSKPKKRIDSNAMQLEGGKKDKFVTKNTRTLDNKVSPTRPVQPLRSLDTLKVRTQKTPPPQKHTSEPQTPTPPIKIKLNPDTQNSTNSRPTNGKHNHKRKPYCRDYRGKRQESSPGHKYEFDNRRRDQPRSHNHGHRRNCNPNKVTIKLPSPPLSKMLSSFAPTSPKESPPPPPPPSYQSQQSQNPYGSPMQFPFVQNGGISVNNLWQPPMSSPYAQPTKRDKPIDPRLYPGQVRVQRSPSGNAFTAYEILFLVRLRFSVGLNDRAIETAINAYYSGDKSEDIRALTVIKEKMLEIWDLMDSNGWEIPDKWWKTKPITNFQPKWESFQVSNKKRRVLNAEFDEFVKQYGLDKNQRKLVSNLFVVNVVP